MSLVIPEIVARILDSAAKNKGLEEIGLITWTPRLLKTIILFHKHNKQQITFDHS